ncbi:hypothetical protein HAX54_013292 [Datura stramonium]|uniref:Uncharacterized protein n=1 Tax=Datura stramonium TaxID=4076 RepID=A0ABS8TNU0_DATST|nr:hypothetical protein [Datura stramonium]
MPHPQLEIASDKRDPHARVLALEEVLERVKVYDPFLPLYSHTTSTKMCCGLFVNFGIQQLKILALVSSLVALGEKFSLAIPVLARIYRGMKEISTSSNLGEKPSIKGVLPVAKGQVMTHHVTQQVIRVAIKCAEKVADREI